MTKKTETVWNDKDNNTLMRLAEDGQYYIPLSFCSAAQLAELRDAINDAIGGNVVVVGATPAAALAPLPEIKPVAALVEAACKCTRDNRLCIVDSAKWCGEKLSRGWMCSREKGHNGAHVACFGYSDYGSEDYHNLETNPAAEPAVRFEGKGPE